jgi:hypothetical protein
MLVGVAINTPKFEHGVLVVDYRAFPLNSQFRMLDELPTISGDFYLSLRAMLVSRVNTGHYTASYHGLSSCPHLFPRVRLGGGGGHL